jgi:hypothetical protein
MGIAEMFSSRSRFFQKEIGNCIFCIVRRPARPGRAVVRGIEPPVPSRPLRASIADASALVGLRTAFALRGIGYAAHPRRTLLGAPEMQPNRLHLIAIS